jgi:hypothetical protein
MAVQKPDMQLSHGPKPPTQRTGDQSQMTLGVVHGVPRKGRVAEHPGAGESSHTLRRAGQSTDRAQRVPDSHWTRVGHPEWMAMCRKSRSRAGAAET